MKELMNLRRELYNQRNFHYVTTFMLAIVVLIMMAWLTVNTMKIQQLKETNAELVDIIKENNKIYQENFVTKEEYNRVVDSVNDLRDFITETSASNNEYKNLLAEHYTNLIADFVTSQNEDKTADLEFVENTSLRSKAPVYYTNDIVESDGYVSEDYFEEVMGYYYQIPKKVRTALAEDGWKIEVTSDELKANDGGTDDRISGVTIIKDKKIYITTLDAQSIVHEIGHFVDYKNDFASKNMGKAYAKDIEGFYSLNDKTSTHNYASLIEYFAESFKLSVLQQNEFKSNCPDTYEFLEQNISNL